VVEAAVRQERDGVEVQAAVGPDRQVRLVGLHAAEHFLAVSLPELQADPRESAPEAPDHGRQRVARLGMRRGDDELAGQLVAKLLADAAHVIGLEQRALREAVNVPPRGRQPGQAIALAVENHHAELALEKLDLLAHARLGGMKRFRGPRKMELVAHDFTEIAQLLERHGTDASIPKNYT
jgi:hypothetical protein